MNSVNEKISENITFAEATASTTAQKLGINNTPPEDILIVMKQTAATLFEPVRKYFGCRIAVTSFYRCPKLNAVLGKNPEIKASRTSQHVKGEALDMNGKPYGGVTNRQLFDYIKEHVDFDQLIWELGNEQEPDWVHVSCKADKTANRKEVLRRLNVNGQAVYTKA